MNTIDRTEGSTSLPRISMSSQSCDLILRIKTGSDSPAVMVFYITFRILDRRGWFSADCWVGQFQHGGADAFLAGYRYKARSVSDPEQSLSRPYRPVLTP